MFHLFNFSYWFAPKDIVKSKEPPGRYKHLNYKGHRYRPTTQSDKRHSNIELYKRRKKNKAAKIARRKNR